MRPLSAAGWFGRWVTTFWPISTPSRTYCVEAGKPLWEARLEIEGLRATSSITATRPRRSKAAPFHSARVISITTHEPYGVSAQVIPWNYPLEMAARLLAPALATGNACVVKTRTRPCPAAIWQRRPSMVDCCASEYPVRPRPRGGRGAAGHHDVNQIVFTGSVATGVSIATAAAKTSFPAF